MKPRRPSSKRQVDRFPKTLFIILVVMALLSGIGLDYMNWSREKTSYLFSWLIREKTLPQKPLDLGGIVDEQLKSLSIRPLTEDQFWDSDQIHHMMIDLLPKDFQRIQKPLEKEILNARATITKKEEHQDEEKRYILWQIKGDAGQKLSVLFSCDLQPMILADKKARPSEMGMVAIIVDDMGYSLKAINDVCALDIPLTVAIIPYSPFAKQTAEIARRNNLEVILHLPLESVNGNADNAMQGIVLEEMSPEEILSVLEDDLAQVPHIKGVNNHMGSKVTRNKKIMRLILQRLNQERLYFIDSLTTGDSVAYSLARRIGIPAAQREVFLDGELDEHYISRQLGELFRIARKNGFAVGICHPNKMTIQTLSNVLPHMNQYQCRPVPASQVVR